MQTVAGLELDYRGEIFQDLSSFDDDINDGASQKRTLTIHRAAADFELDFEFRGRPDTKLFARQFGTYPCVIRASGNRKLLNQIGNYVPLACVACVSPP